MYLFELGFCNAGLNGRGGLTLGLGQGGLKKWNVFPSSQPKKELELLQLLALACSGCTEYLDHLPCDLTQLLHHRSQPLQLEMVWSEHVPQAQGRISESQPKQSGLQITPKGKGKRLLQKNNRLLSHRVSYSLLSKWSTPAKHPVCAYGAKLLPHEGSDDFDFSDPFYQLNRIHCLFSGKARTTDPIAFLNRLNYLSARHKRFMPTQILQTLQHYVQEHLPIDSSEWRSKGADFSRHWAQLYPWQQRLLLPLLDITRHLYDALPSHPNPLKFPGIIILDRPDLFCPSEYFSSWISLLDDLFPAMQMFVTCHPENKRLLSEQLLFKTLPQFSNTFKRTSNNASSPERPRLPAKSILLVDMDNRLPNLALMKLSAYYKQQGYHIRVAKKEAYEPKAEAVFASCIFNLPASRKRLQKMQAYYGDSLHCGGSGIDIKKRLAREVEETDPDFGIYPELGDRALGFLTRGCPFKCPFCIVPAKEGKPRQVTDLDSLTQGGKEKLILLDDNLLAHPRSKELLEEMAAKNLRINFNQTLDLKLVDWEKAKLLRSIPCSNVKFNRNVYHFSLNDTQDLETLREKYNLFAFRSKDNVEFIFMYGFNTTLAQDLERFRFLRSLPGAYVFCQQYQPILGGPEPQLKHFFDERADRYIDELVQICFPQSMKSMEKYFRWLSRRYAEQFGQLHMGLVDTIFRYNKRYNRGKYIASLAGTRKVLD